MIRKISGKDQSIPLKHLILNNTQVTNIKDIANTLAETFSANYSYKLQHRISQIQKKKEKQKLNFKSGNTESYNELFSLSERKETIQTLHNTAVGPDEIHYEFPRHLQNP